jgi:hypothetical protein
MPNISTTDAQGLFTKMIIDVYKQRSTPTSFLRSFFPTVVSPTLELSIEVQRGFEKIAVDVIRGTDGNRNQFTRSSEKIFIPPYYREWFDATQLQLYDRLYGATEINDAIFAAYINSVADALTDLQSKIERSYELQCAQVFLTGIVSLSAGININFQRKAGSLVDPGAGNYFANNIDPFAQFEAGANFLRQVGKAQGGVFNAILGSTALSDLLANTKFTARQNYFNMALDQVAGPQRGAIGQAFHGIITAGAYKIQLWSYPQFYTDSSGNNVPYIDPKKVVMVPENPHFKLGFAAVPQLITPGSAPKVGAFVFNDYIDARGKAHVFDVESAGVAIPTAVDTIYTFKAVA